MHRGPTGVRQPALEVAPPCVVLVLAAFGGLGRERIVGQPDAQLVAEGELAIVEGQVHGSSWSVASRTAQLTSSGSRSSTPRPLRTRAQATSCTPTARMNRASRGGTGRPDLANVRA